MSAEVSLQHSYETFALDAAFRFDMPGITALFGPSGSGKTTIIHAIAGLLQPASGRIVLDGRILLDTANGVFIPARHRRISVVFQDARLFPHLSVRNNLLYGRRRRNVQGNDAEIDAVIALLGLESLLERTPRRLSGGEKSRVALGRALLAYPSALLLDEPLASLDSQRKAEIFPYLERLRDETKIPMLYVSHSLDEIVRLAERIIVLDQGKVAAEGSVFDIAARLDLGTRVEGPLLGAILPAKIMAQDAQHKLTMLDVDGCRFVVPHVSRPIDTLVRIRVDAYDIMLARNEPAAISANNVLPVTISAIHADEAGLYADIQLMLGPRKLVARITRLSLERLQLSPGEHIFAVIKSVIVGGRDNPAVTL